MFKKDTSPMLNFSFFIITAFIIFYILYVWSKLIIPFIIAVLFSFAIIWLSNFYKKFKLPAFISFSLSLATYVFIFWWIWKMIGSNVSELNASLPFYQDKIYNIISQSLDYFPVSLQEKMISGLNNIDIASIFTSVLDTVTSIFSSAWIILFYVMFILLEYRFFKDKLNLMITDPSKKKEVFEIIDKVKNDIKSYFVIKTFISLWVWFLSYLIMIAFWLNFAIFWAFLIFILNFIPNIWSIIAVTFPIAFSLIQFTWDLYATVFLLIFMVWAQVLMWNIVEPKFMWNKLNLSPLVIIVSLWFWWSLWGIVGMLLSVPIMVIINIFFAKIPATRPIAILLSEKWDLQVHWDEEVVKIRRNMIKKVKEKFIKK